jgi:hypothetical protein
MEAENIREGIRVWGKVIALEPERMPENPDWYAGYAVGAWDAYRHALTELEKNTPTKETDERMGQAPARPGDSNEGSASPANAPQLRPDPKVERRRRGTQGKPYRLSFLPRGGDASTDR